MGLDLCPGDGQKLDESPHFVLEIAVEWGRNHLVRAFKSQFDDYFRIKNLRPNATYQLQFDFSGRIDLHPITDRQKSPYVFVQVYPPNH